MSWLSIQSRISCAVAALALAVGALVPAPAFAQPCDQLVAKYDGSNWWWGAFGNCKRPGGPTDRNAIFECAFNQIPPSDRTDCLKQRLLQSEQTHRGIDNVAAANGPPNNCDQLVAKYDGSNWWWGAFGNCKRPGGPTDRNAIFDCAFNQIPASERLPCLRERLLQSDQTRRGIDNVAGANGIIPNNISTVRFTACADPSQGCPEECPLPHDGRVPNEYFAPLMPQSLLDAPPPANQTFNNPPARNIGLNEGRLRPDLRAAARVADPLGCSLRLSAIHYAQGNAEALAQAYADLSVTGRKAFTKFRQALPQESYCQTLATRPFTSGCPAAPASPTNAALVEGCRKALNRAYKVANFLRTGQSLRANSNKPAERKALGWIAVSGEDDSPHRPVNVPSSNFPQFDLDVDVEAPLARPPNPRTVRVRTRFIIAQSKPPPVTARPATGWSLAPDPVPAIAPNAEILLFIHGMDSRAEEAGEIAQALFKLVERSPKNLVVISVDLPTSGYAESLDFERVSPLAEIGNPKLTPLPVPVPIPPELYPFVLTAATSAGLPPLPPVIPPGTPIPDFAATGKTPLLDFIENFIVRFVDTLDRQVPIKNNIKAVMGGSLGGNMSFRLGRRQNLPWLQNVIVWSPASIWDSLGEGADILKHLGPRSAWLSANNRDPNDPNDLGPARLGLRREFFASWDRPIVPIIIPEAQSDTWTSRYWPCKRSSIAGARLDRHETYDPRFLSWHWRLGAEQLLYSHQSADPVTRQPRFMSNTKRMLLACGTEDNVKFNDICTATQRTAPRMVMTPGKALILDKTGHSLDNERPNFWARQIVEFLGL